MVRKSSPESAVKAADICFGQQAVDLTVLRRIELRG